MLFTLPLLLKRCVSKWRKQIIREAGKVLKREGRRFSGCSDRMGRLRQLGEQRAGKVDKGEKGETERRWIRGGEEKEEGRGCFKVSGTDYPWKAINLPWEDDCRGANACTHIQTHREITPLNLVSFPISPPTLCHLPSPWTIAPSSLYAWSLKSIVDISVVSQGASLNPGSPPLRHVAAISEIPGNERHREGERRTMWRGFGFGGETWGCI